MRKLLLLLTLCIASTLSASALSQFVQQRFLPATGVRGTIGEPQPYPLVQVGRRLMRLAPGARVFDQSNRTLVHAHIPPGAEVLFATEQSGDIIRLYILTEQEIGRLAQSGTR